MTDSIRVAGLVQRFGANTILDGLDLEIAPGEFVALLGRSGSGKTTLLRILSGLDVPAAGAVDSPQPRAVAFQEPRSLPWKKTWENVVLGLGADQRSRADAALAEVGLSHRSEAWPHALRWRGATRRASARARPPAEAVAPRRTVRIARRAHAHAHARARGSVVAPLPSGGFARDA
jgi:sulfonate transport system ATP-binding protein